MGKISQISVDTGQISIWWDGSIQKISTCAGLSKIYPWSSRFGKNDFLLMKETSLKNVCTGFQFCDPTVSACIPLELLSENRNFLVDSNSSQPSVSQPSVVHSLRSEILNSDTHGPLLHQWKTYICLNLFIFVVCLCPPMGRRRAMVEKLSPSLWKKAISSRQIQNDFVSFVCIVNPCINFFEH